MPNKTVLTILSKTKNITLGPLIRGAGIPVPCYPDLRALLSNPKNLTAIAGECSRIIEGWGNINLIAGCSMGGITLATAISIQTGLPMIVLRNSARMFLNSLIDGEYKRGQRAVLIDDSIVTGVVQRGFIEELKRVNVKPLHLLTIMDIGTAPAWQKQRGWIHDHGIEVHSLATWTEWALYMRDRGRISRATVQTILHLMEHPPRWVESEQESAEKK